MSNTISPSFGMSHGSYQRLLHIEAEIINLIDKKVIPKTIARYISYSIIGKCETKYNHDLELLIDRWISRNQEDKENCTNILIRMISESGPASPISPPGLEMPQSLVLPEPNFNVRNIHTPGSLLYSTYSRYPLYPSYSSYPMYQNLLLGKLQPFHYSGSDQILDISVEELSFEFDKL